MKTETSLWEQFCPDGYVRKNYETVSIPDLIILARLMDFHKCNGRGKSIIEIGGTVNLYPIFVMLPFYEQIKVTDVSEVNITYLRSQQERMDQFWDQYIRLIRTVDGYLYQFDFQEELRKRVIVEKESIYDLTINNYTHISMNFVAESITSDLVEFRQACRCVMAGLVPGGRLTATFMANSQGYTVKGVEFPAVPVTCPEIKYVFRHMDDVHVKHIPIIGKPLRNGYDGIIHLTAKKNGK